MADALSIKSRGELNVSISKWKLKDALRDFDLWIGESESRPCIFNLVAQPLLQQRIVTLQRRDNELEAIRSRLERSEMVENWAIINDELRFRGRLCVPDHDRIREEVLDECHRSKFSIHLGSNKMYRDMKRQYWWKGMKKDVARYISKCAVCQQVKIEHQRPGGLLQSLPIPEWKWDHITMDFVFGFPRTARGQNAVWVIVDRLTKSAHFLGMKTTDTTETLSQLYIHEVVRLHRVPFSIVLDRDSRFVARFWQSLQQAMGTKLHFSTTFHLQTDGQSERVIQVVEDMLRACMLDFKGNWSNHLPLVEFTYNNSYHESIGMAPYEALYGRPCRSPTCWLEAGESSLFGSEIVRETIEKIQLIRERLRTMQSRQKSYVDRRRRPLEFQEVDYVFHKVSPKKGVFRFGKKGKLAPRYIGPFEVIKVVSKAAYQLQLPAQLSEVHDVFHVSMLRKCLSDATPVVNLEDIEVQDGVTYEEQPVRILDTKEKVLRNKIIRLVKVLWQHHGVEEATLEPKLEIREKYPHLFTTRGKFRGQNFL